MFDPEHFKPPQQTKWERVMRKHGYHFGCAPVGQYILVPDQLEYENGRFTPNIVGEPGESLRDIFIRQGWLVRGEDGKLREA